MVIRQKPLPGDVNKLFVFKSLLIMPRNVLPLHLKQNFQPMIWIFTEIEGDKIKFRLLIKIFSTLLPIIWYDSSFLLRYSLSTFCFFLLRLWFFFVNVYLTMLVVAIESCLPARATKLSDFIKYHPKCAQSR